MIFDKHLFQQVLTEANGYKMSNIKKKGRKPRETEVNIQKSLSIAYLPQSSLYNRNENAEYENEHEPIDEMLRQPHQSVQRSENTALR